jgi:hypothetical protein
LTTSRPGCSEIVLDPGQFALALAGAVRVPIGTSRSPLILVLREAGTRRWICCRTLKRHQVLTPILKRADAPGRIKAFALTDHSPLWEEA